jgi:hypothetical protein
VLDNEGSVSWQGPGVVYNDTDFSRPPAILHNRSGALFEVLGDGTVWDQSYFTSGGNYATFHNHAGAVFRKTAGEGVAALDDFAFLNSGRHARGGGNAPASTAWRNCSTAEGSTAPARCAWRRGRFEASGPTTLDASTLAVRGGTWHGVTATPATLAGGQWRTLPVDSGRGGGRYHGGGRACRSKSAGREPNRWSPAAVFRNAGHSGLERCGDSQRH